MEHYFNTNIAKTYGIEEAILLHHFYYWIAKNAANGKHFHDGLYWTYNSKKAYADFFTYMNETKIFRVIKHLEDEGVVVKGKYNKDKWDKTNWYAITQKGLELLKECGYEMQPFSTSLQNDIFDSCKMNDGTLQSEQSILINNTDRIDTSNNKEKEIDKSISKKGNKFSLDMSFVDETFMPIVLEWLEYKKEKRQSYKQRGFNAMYESLLKMSNNNPSVAKAIVEQSMQNNYAGLFPLKNNKRFDNLPTGMIIRETLEERNEKLKNENGW
jgi:DNA-binding PadR family transcriptional regulator